MKARKIMAAALAVGVALAGFWQTKTLADTVIIEEDMEDGPEDVEAEELNWRMTQKLDVASCKQGEDVVLTVSVTGDTQSMKISTIYGVLQYAADVFEVDAEDIIPVKASSVDYISIDEDSGEIEIYYAGDVSIESGAELLKIRLHALPDADTGATDLSLDALELYATDSDEYAVMADVASLRVNISATGLLGDVNQDKKINLTDAKLIMKHCNKGSKLSAAQRKNADVNKDGKVNLTDAKLIVKYCNGQIKKF